MQDSGTESRINRRNRINLTPEQFKELEKVFEETHFPDSETISELSVQLNQSKTLEKYLTNLIIAASNNLILVSTLISTKLQTFGFLF